MDKLTSEMIKKIDHLLSKMPAVKSSWHSSNMGGHFKDTVAYESIVTEIVTIVTHIYGGRHPHTQRIMNSVNDGSLHSLNQMEGILLGTKSNIEGGFLTKLKSQIILDIETDFLVIANELIADGAKDSAAVLACTVLEDSLKRLAQTHNIENVQGKEMSFVTAALFKKGVIEKSTNGAILSFKALRNSAFHAQWDHVSEETVKMLLVFLPSFIEKHAI